jgi:5-methylcytosine-specific restriction endonuclease McrA
VRRQSRDLGSKGRRAQLERIYQRDRGTCWICRHKVARPNASRDHVTPLAEGGSTADWNVKLAHKACNEERNQAGNREAA